MQPGGQPTLLSHHRAWHPPLGSSILSEDPSLGGQDTELKDSFPISLHLRGCAPGQCQKSCGAPN